MDKTKQKDQLGKTFIGYREKFSLWQAYTVYYYLWANDRVAKMDKEDPDRGNFKEWLRPLILSCEHYALILTPETFQEKKDDEDILLWEIELAIKHKRNIVQFWFNGFNLKKHKNWLPDDIANTLYYVQGQIIGTHNTSGDLDKISTDLLVPKKEIKTYPISKDQRQQLLLNSTTSSIPAYMSGADWSHISHAVSDSDDFQRTSKFLDLTSEESAEWIVRNQNPIIGKLSQNIGDFTLKGIGSVQDLNHEIADQDKLKFEKDKEKEDPSQYLDLSSRDGYTDDF